MPTIELKNVTKYFKTDRRTKYDAAVREVDLTISQGEFVFLVGSSGAGKSTLLRLMSGSLKPDKGSVLLDGRDVQMLRVINRSRVAQVFGQVWQEPTLMRKRTVAENLDVIARLKKRESKESRRKRVDKVLGLVGMSGSQDRYPAELSGGEARRVELARALINSPSILILDEITNNLDGDNIWDIFQLLQELNHKGTTIVMATHASEYVNIMHQRVVTLVNGKIFGDVKRGKYGDIV